MSILFRVSSRALSAASRPLVPHSFPRLFSSAAGGPSDSTPPSDDLSAAAKRNTPPWAQTKSSTPFQRRDRYRSDNSSWSTRDDDSMILEPPNSNMTDAQLDEYEISEVETITKLAGRVRGGALGLEPDVYPPYLQPTKEGEYFGEGGEGDWTGLLTDATDAEEEKPIPGDLPSFRSPPTPKLNGRSDGWYTHPPIGEYNAQDLNWMDGGRDAMGDIFDPTPTDKAAKYGNKLKNRKEAVPIREELLERLHDLTLLRKYVSDHGSILPRKATGLGAKDQRKVAGMIKRARHMGLIPFTGGWSVEVMKGPPVSINSGK